VIQDEIVDETDLYVDMNKAHDALDKTNRTTRRHRPDPAEWMHMFGHKLKEQSKLSTTEELAIVAYLTMNVPEFKPFAGAQGVLRGLVRRAELIETSEDAAFSDEFDDASHPPLTFAQSPVPQHRPSDEFGTLVYERGRGADYFVLVLQGKLIVHAGHEEFVADLGPWSVVGQAALPQSNLGPSTPYVPDFSARTVGGTRLLRVRAHEYTAGLRAAARTQQGNLMSGSRILREEVGGAAAAATAATTTTAGGSHPDLPSLGRSSTGAGAGRGGAPTGVPVADAIEGAAAEAAGDDVAVDVHGAGDEPVL